MGFYRAQLLQGPGRPDRKRATVVRISFLQIRGIDRHSKPYFKAMSILARTDPGLESHVATEEFSSPGGRKRSRTSNLAHDDSHHQFAGTFIIRPFMIFRSNCFQLPTSPSTMIPSSEPSTPQSQRSLRQALRLQSHLSDLKSRLSVAELHLQTRKSAMNSTTASTSLQTLPGSSSSSMSETKPRAVLEGWCNLSGCVFYF